LLDFAERFTVSAGRLDGEIASQFQPSCQLLKVGRIRQAEVER
jgi:hypothetical protein